MAQQFDDTYRNIRTYYLMLLSFDNIENSGSSVLNVQTGK